MPAISYVVPTLNSGKTLDATLLSLKTQTDIDVEVIVVDSGSTDNTLAICERWGVTVLYAPPGNMYAAINLGLSQCTAPWFAYLNSDDVLYTDSLSRLIQYGNQQAVDIVYGNCDYIDFHGRFMYGFRPPLPHWLKGIYRTCKRTGFAQQTSIFRRRLYHSLHGFDTDYQYAADLDFFVRALTSGATFSFLSGPSVACFRLHDSQLSQQKGDVIDQEAQKATTQLGTAKISDRIVQLRWKSSNLLNYIERVI
ncbi:MAG: glycosyltransferase, partial [Cyanobacteria bacterium J06632_3]